MKKMLFKHVPSHSEWRYPANEKHSKIRNVFLKLANGHSISRSGGKVITHPETEVILIRTLKESAK